jgi:hypothetical protein
MYKVSQQLGHAQPLEMKLQGSNEVCVKINSLVPMGYT